jgi:polyisoprenoid-binding protein YceI
MIKTTLASMALAMTLTTGAMAADYTIDTEGGHASINFQTLHLGFSVLNGRFDTFSGSFTFDAENPAASTVSVEIDTASVNSNHGQRDNHLKSGDFLNVGAFPTASFVSTGVAVTGDKTGVITGDFTLRGVTKSIELETEFLAEGKDPWGGFRNGFTGTTSINLGDFGMGGVIGNSDIAITLHVEGIRQ